MATETADSAASTRERILDVALDLFIEQGYDKTSLRDIAERMGFTKAALYYHFERKLDILLELHLRLHAIGSTALRQAGNLEDAGTIGETWPALLDRFIDEVLENRKLILLHQRNLTALRLLADDERHQAENEDIQQRFRRILASPAIPLEQRVRMACSIGAVMGTLLGGDVLVGGSVYGEVPVEQLAEIVRGAVRDLLGAGQAARG